MNTDTVVIKSTAMKHIEGGWPKEVDPTEKQDVTRFVTKAQKQQEYKDALLTMGPVIARCMKQNGTCDIYEGYFDDVEEDHSSTPPSAKVRRWPMLATARSTTLRGTGHRAPGTVERQRRSALSLPASPLRTVFGGSGAHVSLALARSLARRLTPHRSCPAALPDALLVAVHARLPLSISPPSVAVRAFLCLLRCPLARA